MSGHFRPLKSALIRRKIKQLNLPKEDAQYMINRNPRNLEKLRIGYKPDGYQLDKPGRSFWHKLMVNVSGRHITAEVHHFQNGPVIQASTSEWAIRKQLYRTKDTAAFINLGRVLAMRCLQSGITEMLSGVNAVSGGKLDKFLKALEENGVVLEESPRYNLPKPWDESRPEKPWEILEDNLKLSEIKTT